MSKVAILVDGGFYRKRAQHVWGTLPPSERAKELHTYCFRHLSDNHEKRELYRIFYYDCPPMSKKLYHPFLQKQVDFSKSELYKWMTEFLEALKEKRKVAIRLGVLADEQAAYNLRYEILKKLFNGSLKFENLTEQNFF